MRKLKNIGEMNDDYVVIAKARIKATITTRRLCD